MPAATEATVFSAAEAQYARGEAFALLRNWSEAAEAYDAALALQPGYVEAWTGRAIALAELGEFDDALASARAGLEIRPRDAEALNVLGVTLTKIGQSEAALQAAEAALAADPACWAALTTRANALRNLGRIAEALVSYDQSIAAAPHVATARLNRGLCLLLTGDYERGWAEYEWRWRTAKYQDEQRVYDDRLWLGEQAVAGKTVLMHSEQGIGDTIQFCRYAALLAERGATVQLAAPYGLHGLLTSLAGVSGLVGDTRLPAFDLQCPLLSLPLAFGTTVATIPARVPYLRVPARHRDKWRTRLGQAAAPRIGIAWAGNPRYANDRNRSIPLAQVAAAIPEGVEVYCLGREMRTADIPALAAIPQLVFFGSELAEWSDTAALIDAMDLVISVDTGVLHLAGALGRPAWALLPFAADWRWMLEREDTPWYPTVRLFRQPLPGAWQPVLDRVRAALQGRFNLG